jgi:integrase
MVKPFQKDIRDKDGGKKKSKVYYFQVMINGKRIVESTGEVNKNLAVKKAVARERELRGGTDYLSALKSLISCLDNLSVEERDAARNECIQKIVEGTALKMKLEEAFDSYKARPKRKSVSDRTYTDYKNLWEKFIEWIKKEYPQVHYLNEITQNIAEEYLVSEWNKGISERTYNERIKKFRAMFTALSKKAGLRMNVWSSVDKMTERTISKRPLTSSQIRELLRVAEDEMRILFLIGLYTGLRRGDAATLKWEEINLKKNTITRLPGKIKASMKNLEIPIHLELLAFLNFLKNNLDPETSGEYVLPQISKIYLKDSSKLNRMIQKTFIKAGIETTVKREGAKRKTAVYGFHSFRHSFVSMCAEGNTPMHVVMELVGHNSKAVHQVYQHASDESKRKAIEMLPKIEGGRQ